MNSTRIPETQEAASTQSVEIHVEIGSQRVTTFCRCNTSSKLHSRAALRHSLFDQQLASVKQNVYSDSRDRFRVFYFLRPARNVIFSESRQGRNIYRSKVQRDVELQRCGRFIQGRPHVNQAALQHMKCLTVNINHGSANTSLHEDSVDPFSSFLLSSNPLFSWLRKTISQPGPR
jgi:hypothetical protein